MMAKERLVERYGELRYTIGTGCSGGSIAQHTIANAYPGIYQGLVTTCSYPDTLTAGAQFADYHLLRLVLRGPVALGARRRLVARPRWRGRGAPRRTSTRSSPTRGSSRPRSTPRTPAPARSRRSPATRRRATTPRPTPAASGARSSTCMVNLLGPRPDVGLVDRRSRRPAAASRGVPFANTGVQYGLDALQAGPDHAGPVRRPQREARRARRRPPARPSSGSPATPPRSGNAYRTGLINETTTSTRSRSSTTAGPDPGIAHDYAHAFWTEERLLADQGHTDNRVMWFGPTPLIGDPRWANEALLAMDRWLTAVEADRRSVPLADKVVERQARRRHRPVRRRRARRGVRRPCAAGAADPAVDPAAGGRRPAGQRQRRLPAAAVRRGRLRVGRGALHRRPAGRRWSRSSPTGCATGRDRAAVRDRPRPGCATTPRAAARLRRSQAAPVPDHVGHRVWSARVGADAAPLTAGGTEGRTEGQVASTSYGGISPSASGPQARRAAARRPPRRPPSPR